MHTMHVGDAVVRKSGGPILRIRELRATGNAICVWRDERGATREAIFDLDQLRPARACELSRGPSK